VQGGDTTNPSLDAFSVIPTIIDVTNSAQSITANFQVSDAESGLAIVWVNTRSNTQGAGGYSGDAALAGEKTNTGAILISIPQYAPGGTYGFSALVRDKAGNQLTLNHPVAGVTFEVINNSTLIDADGDGFTADVDCYGDNDASVFPGAPELDDDIDNDCDGEVDETSPITDADGDGYVVPADCNDGNSAIYPGAPEIYNDGDDNDCDGDIDLQDDDYVIPTPVVTDLDGDGYSPPLDCDEANPTIRPGANEYVGDLIDNDCDGLVDEEDSGAISNAADEDPDGDGFTNDVDCRDYNPSIHPGAPEIQDDGEDNDCDGLIDILDTPGIDLDGDGYTSDFDCDEGNPHINFGAADNIADGIDNDCDGSIDEDIAIKLGGAAMSAGSSGGVGAPVMAKIDSDKTALITQTAANLELRLIERPRKVGAAVSIAPAGYYGEHFDAATRKDGFSVVWTSPSTKTIRMERFDMTGAPVARFNGDEDFAVNSSVGNYAWAPAISAFGPLNANRSLVVWQQALPGNAVKIMGQRLHSEGRLYGNEFEVSGGVTVNSAPDVARLKNGQAVVVWESGAGFDSTQQANIYARVIAGPTAEPAPIIIVADDAGSERDASVFALGSGFAVLWREGEQKSGPLKAQRYDASGTPLGGRIAITSTGADAYGDDRGDAHGLELKDGTFIVVWAGADNHIYGQRFAADGAALGGAVTLSNSAAIINRFPSIEQVGPQSILIVWIADSTTQLRRAVLP